ncbi:MAG: TrkA family potassium uptake protein, partial [Oscillospiraceae bacterium]|nr:TrkA family potassium uptake protein [Oscillospiraceae bacterium]
SAKIADCTREEALQGIGVKNFDVCFVCTGSDFQASLEITSRLSEMGAKKIISKASTDIHAKFLLRNGADEVVYPERDRAVELAVKYSDTRILDFAQMDDDIGIYEVSSADSWWGKTISSLGIRTKYKLNILAVKRDHKTIALPEPSFEIQKGDALIVMAEKTSLDKYLKSVKTR